MKTMLRFWNEETGAIISAEIMLVASILVIGMVVGLASVRNAVITELADVAQALSNVNQSYTFSGAAGHHTFVGGGRFTDLADFCDTAATSDVGQASKCVSICLAVANPIGVGDTND